MIRLCWCAIIISVITLPLCAQDRLLFSRNEADSVSRALYQKYLSKPGNEEENMKELLQLAMVDDDRGDLQGALRKFQIGLLLEKSVPPGKTTFDFNLRLAEIIARINRGYALEFFTKAAQAAKADPSIHPSRVYHMYNNKALSHQHLMEYDSAVYYYKQAIESAKDDNPVSVSSTLNNLGMFYAERQAQDSAHHYFQKALDILGDKENHITLYTSIKDNIAQLYILDKRYDLAIPIFQFNDSVYIRQEQPWQYVINKVRLLKALDAINDSSIHKIIQQLQDYIEQKEDRIPENVLLDFYSFSNDYYFASGQHKHQVFFREKMKTLSASLEKNRLELLDQLSTLLLDMQESSLRSDISAYQLQAQKQQLQIRSILFVAVAATLALCLIILSMIMYLRKRRYQLLTERKLADAELQQKEMEARLLEQDLELKKRDLTNVVLHNTQVYDTNQKLIERIEEIRKNKNSQDDQLRSLLIDLQSKNQISDRTIGLQSNIDSVNAEFHDRLKSAFPDLTKSEEELCGYIRINLSTKDISILKNVAASSVKMSKTRLRKKLGVTPEEDLYEFIRGI